MQNNEISKWELRKVYCNLLPELRNEIVLHAVQECVYVCVCVVEHFNLAVNLILINTINVTIEVHTHKTRTTNSFSFAQTEQLP